MKAVVSWGNQDDSFHETSDDVDEWIVKAVDAEIESLDKEHRSAVRLVYLREEYGAVFRSNRMSMERAALLCDEAELQMIPRLRAKGVVLGGS